MTARSSPAEIRLHRSRAALNGAIIGVTAETAYVHLSAEGRAAEPLPGEIADLIAVDGGRLVAALVTVESVRGDVVALRFAASGQSEDRRRLARQPVDLPVVMRSASSTGAHGAWTLGRVLDLSTGGLRVRYPAGVGKPEYVEIQLALGRKDGRQAGAAVQPAAKRSLAVASRDRMVIRSTCRVAGVRHFESGQTELRLEFRGLSHADQLTLASYLAGAAIMAAKAARKKASEA